MTTLHDSEMLEAQARFAGRTFSRWPRKQSWFRKWLIITTLLPLPACDPAWSYVATGGQRIQRQGYWFELPPRDGLGLAAHCLMDRSQLSVFMEIKNVQTGPVTVDLGDFRAYDATGKLLKKKKAILIGKCSSAGGASTFRIDESESCEFHTKFWVDTHIDGLFLKTPNPDLSRIEIGFKANRGSGDSAELRIPFDWSN